MRALILLSVLLLPLLMWAQNGEDEFAKLHSDVVGRYRALIFAQQPEAIRALDSLVDLYVKASPELVSRKEIMTSLNNLLLYTDMIPYPFDAVIFAEIKERQKKKLDGITTTEARIISDCKPLIEMFWSDLLEADYPFEPLPADEYDARFLKFIQPQKGDIVAEVGAGNGYHGLLLAAAYPESIFVLNELVGFYTNYINHKVSLYPEVFGRDRVAAIVGNKRETMMKEASVDHLLINNTYHHFTKEKEMLSSIRKTLKATGSLYIIEPVYLGKRERSAANCRKVMPRAEVIEEITDAGFRLVEEQSLEEWYFLRFEVE